MALSFFEISIASDFCSAIRQENDFYEKGEKQGFDL